MKTLALDLGRYTGYAHPDGHVGVWDLGNRSAGDQLANLRTRLFRARREWGFERIGYEEASMGSNNRNTAARHNEKCGVVRLVANELGVEVISVNPTSLKAWATGSGRAKKPQMIAAVNRMYGLQVTDDNEADAIWILKYVEAGVQPATKKARRKRTKKTKVRGRLF